MSTRPVSTEKTSTRSTFACIRCAERKVKCDRQKPCSACAKHNVDCVFNTTKPPRKKRKRVKVKVLADRLNQYEALLQKHGIDPDELPSKQCPTIPLHQEAAGLLVREPNTDWDADTPASRYEFTNLNIVENSLWSKVMEESRDSEVMLENSESSSNFYDSDDEHGFVLSVNPRTKEKFKLPPLGTMQQLWEVFVENFDPLTKIVHVPTLRPAFQRATSNPGGISRNFEALMFAIFGAAILTLNEDDCQQMFNEPRRSILSRYTSATEAALARAKFMATTSLVVLQALVIHIFSIRDFYEPRAVWTLTGVAVRIAQSIGLDRDGTILGHSFFDTEIRRRTWWQLKSHDFRAAELCGLAKFRDMATGGESPKWPANINDNDLHPGMISLEVVSTGITDASFIAFKFEMTNFAASRVAAFRKLGKDPSEWNLDTPDNDRVEIKSAVEALEERLEMNYLRYCDPSQPLHLMLLLVGRYGMNTVTFLTHHPRRWASMEHVPLSERTLVWDCGIKLLEQYSMMQSNPLLKPFAWHALYFQPWHALIHVLDTLYAEPSRSDASKAWAIICSIYEHTPDLVSDMRKPVHVAIGKLCLKAYAARETLLLGSTTTSRPTPTCIIQLCERSELAKAKHHARNKKADRQGEHNVLRSGNSNYNEALQGSISQNSTIPTSTNFDNHDGAPENASFYFFDGFDDNNSHNDMYMDLDFVLPEGCLESYAPEQVDWEQWDTWLADSNMMRSSSC